MPHQKQTTIITLIFFSLTLLAYIVGQATIGAYDPSSDSWHYDAPADIDFLYYAGILEQMKHGFPPQNPAYGGEMLSQSFVQYYPTMLLSLVVNPYIAMRIMNLVYLLLMALVLRHYFTRLWGLGLAVIAAGSVGFGLLNSLGVDLIGRGFNHFPFFMVLVIALYEKKKSWLRYVALFALGWLHSLSAILVCLYLIIAIFLASDKKQAMANVVACGLGVAGAALLTLGVADKPFYFPLVEGFRFDPGNIWMHALPTLAVIILAGDKKMFALWAVVCIFGLFFHYNPFFPVFLMYAAAGLAMASHDSISRSRQLAIYGLAGLLFIGFCAGSVAKYSPATGGYYPHQDTAYHKAAEWLRINTPPESVILTVPLETGWTCRLQEVRALYLGFIPHVAHLGIDWRERAKKMANYFAYPTVYRVDADYVIYGPMERNLFPVFGLKENPAYEDEDTKIWKLDK